MSIILRYIQFYIKAKSRHGVHSPFVFDLMENVFKTDREFYCFEELEAQRNRLLTNEEIINVLDLGAGSRKLKSKQRKIKDIAKTAISPTQYCEIIFQLLNEMRAETIFEIGTSLGVSTSYFSKACPKAKIYSFEGCPETAKIAKRNFKELECDNIELIIGNFDDTLQKSINSVNSIDLAFIDGNHQKEATLRYAIEIIKKTTEDSILIIDDIYWSNGMMEAWDELVKHPEVTLSIDLFKMGLLFFRKGIEKQQFYLKV